MHPGVDAGSGSPPVLVVVYDLGAAPPTRIVAAARGLCDVVMLADRRSPHVDRQFGLMRDIAEVIDITGMPNARIRDAVAHLAPSGVVTFAEYQVDLAASLARDRGLPGHGAAVVDALTDKLRQRMVLAEAGVQSTAVMPISGIDDVPTAAATVGFPAVLKPRRGAGSIDTCRVESAENCVSMVKELDVGSDRTFVLEELLIGATAGPLGDYVSVESVVQGERISTVCVTGKFPLAEPFRETGCVLPSMVTGRSAEQMIALAHSALTALGVRDGVCQTEIKLTPAGPRVIEVNGRMSGHIAEVLQRATGHDLVRTAMRVALGQPVFVPDFTFEQVTYQRWVIAPADSREVTSLAPLEELAKLPGVARVDTKVGVGQRLDWRHGTPGRLAVVSGTADSHQDLPPLITATDRAARAACR